MDPSSGQHFIMDHQRTLRRAEACARLTFWPLSAPTMTAPTRQPPRNRNLADGKHGLSTTLRSFMLQRLMPEPVSAFAPPRDSPVVLPPAMPA